MGKSCSIIVCSCDKNEDIWYPFFKILDDEWENRPQDWQVYLNTETKSFAYKDWNIKTFGFYNTLGDEPWSKRMIRTLKAINSEYVIFILDDYFQTKEVNQKGIEQCIEWMENTPKIAAFYFSNIHNMDEYHVDDNKYPGFELDPNGCPYCVCAQTSIWRRKRLLHYLNPHEDIWQFEVRASERALFYDDVFYSAKKGEDYIFEHDWINAGALRGGMWTETAKSLLEKHSISMDYSVRGFYTYDMPNPSVPRKESTLQHFFRPPLLKRVMRRIRNCLFFIE